jgi:hypothetical protein
MMRKAQEEQTTTRRLNPQTDLHFRHKLSLGTRFRLQEIRKREQSIVTASSPKPDSDVEAGVCEKAMAWSVVEDFGLIRRRPSVMELRKRRQVMKTGKASY